MKNYFTKGASAIYLLCISFTVFAQLPAGSVVDAWFVNPDQVRGLRDRLDIWGVDIERGSYIVYLPDGDTSLLDVASLSWELNVKRTQQVTLDRSVVRGSSGIPGFSCYRTVQETFESFNQLEADNPDLVEIVDIGDSFQKTTGSPGAGFDINLAVITNENSPFPKSKLVIIAAIHAREYATAELATRFAEMLVSGFGNDADITWLLDHNELHIVPQLNPDGRIVAEQSATQFKRKNDNENFCPTSNTTDGVDLNRNSDVFFGLPGSSGTECSDTFRGPSANSEPETSSIQQYLVDNFPDLRPGPNDAITTPVPEDASGLFISIHSFSNLVLFPWEGVSDDSGNHNALRSLARKVAFFNDYTACQDCLGTAAGTTPDFAYGELGLAALTYELGATGFFPTCEVDATAGTSEVFEQDILPINLDSLLFAFKSARRPYQEPQGPEVTDIEAISFTINRGDKLRVNAQASDQRRQVDQPGDLEGPESLQNIISGVYSIDIPPFAGGTTFPVSADDGVFNSMTETLSLEVDTLDLEEGQHTLFIVATDDSGQPGPPSAVFFEVVVSEEFFIDGFEGL